MDFSQFVQDSLETLSRLPGPAIYCTIVGVLLACGLGVPMPEDITLIAAGLMASTERISFTGALIAGFSGVMLGDAFLFFLGRKFGKRIFQLPGFRRIFTPDRVLAAENRIRKNGPFICFVARFLPGLRSPVFAMSGALGVRVSTFFLLDGFAALISVPVWVFVGYWFGNNFEDAFDAALEMAERLQAFILTGLAVVILSYVGYKLWKRRRRTTTELPAPGIADLKQGE